MIVNHTDTGQVHMRYDMDTKLIEMYVNVDNAGNGRLVFMRPHQAEKLIETLQRLVDAHRTENRRKPASFPLSMVRED